MMVDNLKILSIICKDLERRPGRLADEEEIVT